MSGEWPPVPALEGPRPRAQAPLAGRGPRAPTVGSSSADSPHAPESATALPEFLPCLKIQKERRQTAHGPHGWGSLERGGGTVGPGAGAAPGPMGDARLDSSGPGSLRPGLVPPPCSQPRGRCPPGRLSPSSRGTWSSCVRPAGLARGRCAGLPSLQGNLGSWRSLSPVPALDAHTHAHVHTHTWRM